MVERFQLFLGMEELYTKNEQVRKSLNFFSRVNSAGFQGQLSRKVYVLDNCLEILYDLWGYKVCLLFFGVWQGKG